MFSSSLLKLNQMRLGVFQKHSCAFFTLVISDFLLNAKSAIIVVHSYSLSFNISVLTVVFYKSLQKGVRLNSIFRGISYLKVR